MVQQWQTVKGQSSFLKKKTYHISEHCSVNSPLIRALFKIESVRNQCLEQNWRSCRYNQWIPQPSSPPRVVNPLLNLRSDHVVLAGTRATTGEAHSLPTKMSVVSLFSPRPPCFFWSSRHRKGKCLKLKTKVLCSHIFLT